MRPNRCRLSLVCLILLFGTCGCGGSRTVKVSGKVTRDGQPFPKAIVTFIPLNDKIEHRIATGITDSDGVFRLTSFNPNDGALPGEYKVTVQYEELGVESLGEPGQKASIKTMMQQFEKQVKEQKKKKDKIVIPAKYSSARDTILKATIPADGPINLDTQSK